MRFDVQDDVEVSRRPAPDAAFAIGRRAQPRAGIHARRDFDSDLRGTLAPPGAVTRATGLVNHPAGALASRAGLSDAEDAARTDHLSAASAGRTGLRR